MWTAKTTVMNHSSPITHDFLSNDGKMAELIAQYNWKKHPLGEMKNWPHQLTATLAICLHSQYPMALYWGEELYTFYNDAWVSIAGEAHPKALGTPASTVWKDIWPILQPTIQRVFDSKRGSPIQKSLLPLSRLGYTREAYFDYTFIPLIEDDVVTGLLHIGTDVTSQYLIERRNRSLRRLTEKSVTAESAGAACILAANILSENPDDIPYSLIYLLNHEKNSLRLVASSSTDTDDPFNLNTVSMERRNRRAAPFVSALQTRKPFIVRNFAKKYKLPSGSWDEKEKEEAIIMPLIRPQTKELYGVIVLGISPLLSFDTSYSDYFRQIAEQIMVAVGSADDLQRKLSVEAREREIQLQLQAALSQGLIGIWSWDILSDTVIADSNLAKQFGIEPSEARKGLPLSSFLDSIHEEDRSKVKRLINKSVRLANEFKTEYRVVSTKGEIKWVIARGRIQTDDNGKPIRFPGVTIDITERKLIEEKLANAERSFTALFESSIMGVLVADFEGKIHEANRRFLKTFGYTKRDLTNGMNINDIRPKRRRNVKPSFYKHLRQTGQLEPVEKEYFHKNGSSLPILMGAVRISNKSSRYICFMLDISERKKLLALNQSKDEFISIASHQLRTPATGVKQYLGMLLEGYAGEIKEDQLKIIQTAYQSNERQLLIVNDLLKVAQADASQIILNTQQVDVKHLLQEIVNEQGYKFKSRNQHFSYKKPNKSVIAVVDPFRLRMVFENLLDNATKYTPTGNSIDLSLSVTGKNLRISVKDQGVGVRKKDMHKLFMKFSRIENHLSTTAGGTGLGLYWVKKIVDLHHGSISAESTYRKGSEFVILLPTGITKV